MCAALALPWTFSTLECLLRAARLQPAPEQTRQATLSPLSPSSKKTRNAPVQEQADDQMFSSDKKIRRAATFLLSCILILESNLKFQ